MALDNLYSHFKDWFDSKRSPFFGTAMVIWLFCNRPAIYGIFNFPQTLTIDQKLNWVHGYLELFNFPFTPWRGVEASIAWSLLIALIVMPVGTIINSIGDTIFNAGSKKAVEIRKWSSPSDWVPKNALDELDAEKKKLENDLRQSQTINNSQGRDIETLNNSLSTIKSVNSGAIEERDKNIESLSSERIRLMTQLEVIRSELKERDDEYNRDFESMQSDESPAFKSAQLAELEMRIRRSESGRKPTKIWQHNGDRLVVDFEVEGKYKIAVDTIKFPDRWEIQLFGRKPTDKEYLLGVMLNHPLMMDGMVHQERDNRIIWFSTTKGDLNRVKIELLKLIEKIDAYKRR